MRCFSTSQISQITGFSKKQLDYWAREKIIVPSIQQSSGPGSRKIYSVDDLVKLQFIKQLKKYGWSSQKIGVAVKTLATVVNDPNPLNNAVLIHGKTTIIALCKTRQGERIMLDALNAGGQQVMGIVVEMLLEEVLRITKKTEQPGLEGIVVS